MKSSDYILYSIGASCNYDVAVIQSPLVFWKKLQKNENTTYATKLDQNTTCSLGRLNHLYI